MTAELTAAVSTQGQEMGEQFPMAESIQERAWIRARTAEWEETPERQQRLVTGC